MQGKSKADKSDVGGSETYESKADEDKPRACQLYDVLDLSKLWTLKSGTIVKDTVKQVAISLEYQQ